MRNPFRRRRASAPSERQIRISTAMNEASGIVGASGYQPPSDYQKFIELTDMRLGLRELHDRGYDSERYSRFLEEKLGDLMSRIVQGVEAGEAPAVEKGLELLSQYYGYPEATRMGGVPEGLADAMRAHNAEGSGVEIPLSLIDRADALYEQQTTWPNFVRRERWQAAVKTLHTRYPADFLNEMANVGVPNEHMAAQAHVMGEP